MAEDIIGDGYSSHSNLTHDLNPARCPQRQRGQTSTIQPRDSLRTGYAAATHYLMLSNYLAYAQPASFFNPGSALGAEEPWGAAFDSASQALQQPSDGSSYLTSNGLLHTNPTFRARSGDVFERRYSCLGDSSDSWLHFQSIPHSLLGPVIYAHVVHDQLQGYYAVPPGLLVPSSAVPDEKRLASANEALLHLGSGDQSLVYPSLGAENDMVEDPIQSKRPSCSEVLLKELRQGTISHYYEMARALIDSDDDMAARLSTNTNYSIVKDPDFSLGYRSNIKGTPLSDFKDCVVGVEATAYLQHMIDEGPAHEPLLAALGGDPIGLKYHIENELDRWQEHGIRPLFVFDGQSIVGKDEMALRNARAALVKTQTAWNLYGDHQPNEAVKAFGSSGAVRVQDLYRVLQQVLAERSMEFMVAPFSACAQLVFLLDMDGKGKHYIHAVMGSRELLLYDKSPESMLILPPSTEDWENKVFHGVFRSEAMEKLGVSSEMLDDALFMVGTTFLSPFPPLQMDNIISSQPYTLVDAINLLRTSEKSITSTCAAFQDILEKRDPKWLDKYRKAKMGVKHAVVVQEDGTVISRDYENLTSDNNEYLGLQLPPELYYYLSKAMIGPRIMNYFINLELLVFPTLDGVISEEYKRLVTRTLIPLKEMTAGLIAQRIHRVFQFKNITIRFWFDDNLSHELAHKTTQAGINSKADPWEVFDTDLRSVEKTLKLQAGGLSFAALSLQEKDFSLKTFRKSSKDATEKSYLVSNSEILSSAQWRLLHLRGYVNDQHELTNWGKALAVTLKTVQPIINQYKDIHQIEEAAFLAFELIRFDNLNSRNRHPELIGGPLRGSDEDKANCILIGRAACLLKLRHKNVGYTGPLSKNFLAYHSIVKAVRETDRDLVESIVASMFMSDQVDRSKSRDYSDLGRRLPFAKAINTIFGIAVTTYLDDFLKLDWTPEERLSNKSHYAERFVPHSINFVEDLEVAFVFFDALYAGVKTLSPSDVPEVDFEAWESAKAYLEKRR